jgi:hypothetical protein
MKAEIYRKDGQLSEYGLCCGYVQKSGERSLYKEGGIYHVREGAKWETFDKLPDARKRLKTI